MKFRKQCTACTNASWQFWRGLEIQHVEKVFLLVFVLFEKKVNNTFFKVKFVENVIELV